MDVCPACYLCTLCMQYLWGPEEGVGSETGVLNGCELSCGGWESNSGPLPRAASALNHGTISPDPTFFFIRFKFFYLCGCMFLCKHTLCVWIPLNPEEGVRSPETGLTDGFELLYGDARSQTQVLCKSSQCS